MLRRHREAGPPVAESGRAVRRAPKGPVWSLLSLQSAAGNRAVSAVVVARQRSPQTPKPARPAPAPVRHSIVAIMGTDQPHNPNQFYTFAERYWRAHMSSAQFITNQRNLADLLTAIQRTVGPSERVGELIIVSHANEDGVLSFGLDAGDTDGHVSFRELRAAVTKGKLPQLGARVDAQTRIRIKGCDIGRSQQMIDLVDEAFGGAGVVTAPTHEQGYTFDDDTARAAVAAREAQIRTEVNAAHPQIPPVPKVPVLPRGATRAEIAAHRVAMTKYNSAVAERKRLVHERDAAIDSEVRGRHGEAKAAGELAGTVEQFGGPMFQRPGHVLFTVDELRAEVDRLYGHLSKARRAALTDALAAPDKRSPANQRAQGTFQQRGQRVDRQSDSFTFPDPQTAAEAQAIYGPKMREEYFTPAKVQSHRSVPATGGFRVETVLAGSFAPPERKPYNGIYKVTAPTDDMGKETLAPDDQHMIASAQEKVTSPDKFAWGVTMKHAANGQTTRTVTGERVIAYLHHESLNASPHEHFTRPESDPNFFSTSTFTPPPAKTAKPVPSGTRHKP